MDYRKHPNYILKKTAPKSWALIPLDQSFFKTKILDALTSDPISEVYIHNLNNENTTYSDRNGNFFIEITSVNDSIQLYHPSYIPSKISVKNNQSPIIKLNPETEYLNEVIVREYIQKGIRKNIDGSIELTGDDLRILPGIIEQDVLQNLQTLPGISSPSENASLIYVRGGAPDQNNTLWNGIQVYSTGHFLGEISVFNPFITKKTTFYKSGTRVRYGNRIGGVIELESKNETPSKNKYSIGSDLITLSGDAHIKLTQKSNILFGFRRANTDFLNTIADRNLSTKNFENTRLSDRNDSKNSNNQITFSDFSVGYNLKFDSQNSLRVNGLFFSNKLTKDITVSKDYESVSSFEDLDLNDDPITVRSISFENSIQNDVNAFRSSNYGLSFISENKISKKHFIRSKLYFSKFKSQYSITSNDLTDLSFFNTNLNNPSATSITKGIDKVNQTDIIVNDVEDLYFESFLKHQLSNNNSIDFGYQFSRNEGFFSNNFLLNFETQIEDNEPSLGVNGFNSTIEGKVDLHTITTEFNHSSNKINLNLGYRLTQTASSSSIFFEPRTFVSLKLSNHHRITSSFEIKNQFINLSSIKK